MKSTSGHLLLTATLAAAVLLAISQMARAEVIYDIDGVFAPSFVNQDTPSFTGEMTFPNDVVNDVTGWLQLETEAEPRYFTSSMALNLPGSLFQPWDTRLYAGLTDFPGAEEQRVFTMFLVDYDQTAGNVLDATMLDEGGGWDAWAISLPDYPVGSLRIMQPTVAVNEPAAMALLAIGAVIAIGMFRETRRR